MTETEVVSRLPAVFIEPQSVTEAFNRINGVISHKDVLTLPPKIPASDAVHLMRERGCSQLLGEAAGGSLARYPQD